MIDFCHNVVCSRIANCFTLFCTLNNGCFFVFLHFSPVQILTSQHMSPPPPTWICHHPPSQMTSFLRSPRLARRASWATGSTKTSSPSTAPSWLLGLLALWLTLFLRGQQEERKEIRCRAVKSISTIEICTSTTANHQMKRNGLGFGVRQSNRYRFRLKHSSEVYGNIFRPAVIKELLSVVSLSHTHRQTHISGLYYPWSYRHKQAVYVNPSTIFDM